MKNYTVKELAQIAGVTPRTLRHYDKINLLVPKREGSGEYRVYGNKEVDRLQEILLYRELGFELSEIGDMIDGPVKSREERLRIHLNRLLTKRANIDSLIKNVEDTIKSEKGEIEMSDNKKFQGMKQEMIDENERKYGKEIREKYGEETVGESNRKMMKLSKEDFEDMKKLAAQINQRLEDAVKNDISTDSEEAMEIAKLHKKWLTYSWPDYSGEAHKGVTEMYVADERFKKYYDANVDGCAEFLRDAVRNYVIIN